MIDIYKYIFLYRKKNYDFTKKYYNLIYDCKLRKSGLIFDQWLIKSFFFKWNFKTPSKYYFELTIMLNLLQLSAREK